MTNKEAILSKYLSPRHGVVTKENALKAMDEYAASSPSLREALEGLLKIIDDSYGVFDHYEEDGAKDTGVTKWAVFKEEIQAARTALEGDGIDYKNELEYAMAECNRLSDVATYWQKKYLEQNPGWQPPKLDNF